MTPLAISKRLQWLAGQLEAPRVVTSPDLIGYPLAPLNGGKLDPYTPGLIGEWILQPKVDNWRGVVHAPTQTVWNQYGQLSSCADKFGHALDTLHALPFEWLDVGLMESRHDLMRGCIIVFDVMAPNLTFTQRRAGLRALLPAALPEDMAELLKLTGGQLRDAVFLINQWDNGIERRKLSDFLQVQNKIIGHKLYEGIIAKRANSLYPIQQTPKEKFEGWIKHRFDQ